MDLLRKVDKVRIYAFDGTPGASYILPHANPSEFVTDYEEQYAEEFENPKKVKRRRLPGRISFRRYTLARSTRGQRLYFMKKIPTNNSVGEKEKEIFTLSRETIVGYKALWSVRIYGRTLSNIMNLMTHNRIDLLKVRISYIVVFGLLICFFIFLLFSCFLVLYLPFLRVLFLWVKPF